MRGVSVLVLMAALACSSCGSSDPEQAGGVPPPPEVGDCRNTPKDLDPEDVFDDSPVVDCSQAHTLETLAVIQTGDELPTRELLEEFAKYCHTGAVADYLDIPGPGPYKWAWPMLFGPTPEQQDAGQSWVRCDMGFWGETSAETLVSQTGSLEGAMGKDIARFQQCLAEVPDPDGRSQELVSCNEPHRAEYLLTITGMEASAYPPAAKLRRRVSHSAMTSSPIATTPTR